MANHPNRGVLRSIRPLGPQALAAMNDYVDWMFRECMSDDQAWPLGEAWRAAENAGTRSHIAAAMIYQADSLDDPPYQILGPRGRLADERLCLVADELRLAE